MNPFFEQAAPKARVRTFWWVLAAFVLLISATVLGAMIGPAGRVNAANWSIVWHIRMPRGVLAGSCWR